MLFIVNYKIILHSYQLFFPSLGYTAAQHKQFAQKYLVPSKLFYVVVGDAATQLAPLEQLGLGKPILIKN